MKTSSGTLLILDQRSTHLVEDGYDIRTVQELMPHAGVATMMIDTHVRPGLPNQTS
jgi:site-specific recombinase XerC